MKIKRVQVHPEALVKVMSGDTCWRVQDGVPKGSIVKGAVIDPYTNILNIFVEHDSFEEVPEGQVAPILKTSFRKVQ